MRRRLRSAWTDEELAQIYARPHVHTQWPDHVIRVGTTIDLGRKLCGSGGSGADLSCGDGAILNGLDLEHRYLGDYAPGYEYTGPIEQTIQEIPHVDVYVCCETLEHLDDPDAALKLIRGKADLLLLSTPVENWADDNTEHYWAWSLDDLDTMLTGAGFTVEGSFLLDFREYGPEFYCFAIIGCR